MLFKKCKEKDPRSLVYFVCESTITERTSLSTRPTSMTTLSLPITACGTNCLTAQCVRLVSFEQAAWAVHSVRYPFLLHKKMYVGLKYPTNKVYITLVTQRTGRTSCSKQLGPATVTSSCRLFEFTTQNVLELASCDTS